MTKTVLCDLDGTICDTRHRKHLIDGDHPDWRAYSMACASDRPIKGVITLLDLVSIGDNIVLWSGRHEAARKMTERWLALAHVRYDVLLMRWENDVRPNVELKLGMLSRVIDQGFQPALAIDDHPGVLEALSARRIPGLLVARDGVARGYKAP